MPSVRARRRFLQYFVQIPIAERWREAANLLAFRYSGLRPASQGTPDERHLTGL